jgi:hypothetical protein
MENEMIKVKLTMCIPFDKPTRNGTIFTKEAVANAVNNIPLNMPIVCKDSKSEYATKVIGTTTENSHIVTWDFENQTCKVTVDGVVFHSGAEIIINGVEGDKISDCRIAGIGIIT